MQLLISFSCNLSSLIWFDNFDCFDSGYNYVSICFQHERLLPLSMLAVYVDCGKKKCTQFDVTINLYCSQWLYLSFHFSVPIPKMCILNAALFQVQSGIKRPHLNSSSCVRRRKFISRATYIYIKTVYINCCIGRVFNYHVFSLSTSICFCGL